MTEQRKQRKTRLWVCGCCRRVWTRKKDDVGKIMLRKATEKMAGSIHSGDSVIGKSHPTCDHCQRPLNVAQKWPKARIRLCKHDRVRAERVARFKAAKKSLFLHDRVKSPFLQVNKPFPTTTNQPKKGKETISMSKKKAVEKYEAKHGKKFKCGDLVKKEAYVTKIKDGWRVRCHKHHTIVCKKLMRRLRKAA